LKNFALEALKVDRSFVADLTNGRQHSAICGAIVAMGRELGLRVVAEGVETIEQLQMLREQGCTLAQGYLIARPATAADMPLSIDTWRAAADRIFGEPVASATSTNALTDSEADAVLERGVA
jgi:EAL domain-containing protein (putative c-di-GMP-specific phosphodiesterase class I)